MRLLHFIACIGLVLAADLPIAGASKPAQQERVRVGVALDRPGPDLAHIAPPMIKEANAVWRQHGVMVVDLSSDVPPVDVRLNVTVIAQHGLVDRWTTRQTLPAGDGRLGEIVFDDRGGPTDAIVLDADAVVATLRDSPVIDASADVCILDLCPATFLESITARALGRVLAHEIGHYLLALRSHTRFGLMRSAFDGPKLAGRDRHAFELSAELLPRLHDRLASLRQAP